MKLPTPPPGWQDRPHPLSPRSPRPPRLSRRLRIVLIGGAASAVVLIGLIIAEAVSFSSGRTPAPQLTEMTPLPPATRNSLIMTPVSIALSAIRDAAEKATPRNFAGKAQNPATQILQNADINWTASRGAIATTGAQDVLTLTTPILGKLNVTGSLSSKATGAVGEALGSLLGGNAAKQIGSINIKNLNASAEIKGNITIAMRPRIAANWHLEPNFSAQVDLGDTSMSVGGAKVNVPGQVKPVIDKTVNDQLNAIGDRIRNDPTLMRNARAQWAKACRSLPLQGEASGLPALWLEIKPTRALAAQPVIDANAVTATLGLEAETRVTAAKTTPDCPFPEKINVIPPTTGGINVAVPIDMPFTALNKIIDAQLAGKTFPEDGSGPVAVTVKRATITPSGGRLLISLLVHAKEKESYFGFGAEATVHIWGRPLVDQARQTLSLTDLQLAVESDAAFGLLGAAARAAEPQLERGLSEKTVIDLKPIASNAREKIAAGIAEFQKNENGIRVVADVSSLTLTDIAFDSQILRITASAEGTLKVIVAALPGL